MKTKIILEPGDAITFKKLRKAHGMTLEQMAAKCGCSPTTIRKTEIGYGVPRKALREKIVEVLGVDIVWPKITNPGPIPKKKIEDKEDE